jgi:hypothetical protein
MARLLIVAGADTSPAADRQGRLDVPDAEAHEWSRVFSWQEKVFSKAEAEAFKVQLPRGSAATCQTAGRMPGACMQFAPTAGD